MKKICIIFAICVPVFALAQTCVPNGNCDIRRGNCPANYTCVTKFGVATTDTAGQCIKTIEVNTGMCIPPSSMGLGGGRGVIASENNDTVLPCPKPAVGVAAPTAVSPAPSSAAANAVARAMRLAAAFTSRAAAPAASFAGSAAVPGAAVSSVRGGVFGPRDKCKTPSAQDQRDIDMGNQTVINRIFCPSATPQCCTSPLPGAGEPMGICQARGTVCRRPAPRDPNPKKDPPKKDCRMEGGVLVCTIPGL